MDVGELFDAHYDEIRAYLGFQVERSLAEELAAETFTEAYDHRAEYDPRKGAPRTWLYGIASNLLHGHFRKEGSRGRAYARLRMEPDREEYEDACNRADAGSLRAFLQEVLAELSHKHREALLLTAWADLTTREIADALDIPEGTVKSRLHRAREIVSPRLQHAIDLGRAGNG